MDLKSKIVLIAGPTASGKSEFAIKVAKKINGEIINADSMQVYKQLQILTARPNKIDQKKIKHQYIVFGFDYCKLQLKLFFLNFLKQFLQFFVNHQLFLFSFSALL